MYNAKDVSAVFVFGFRTQVRPALARVRRFWRRSCCDTQLSLPSPVAQARAAALFELVEALAVGKC